MSEHEIKTLDSLISVERVPSKIAGVSIFSFELSPFIILCISEFESVKFKFNVLQPLFKRSIWFFNLNGLLLLTNESPASKLVNET